MRILRTTNVRQAFFFLALAAFLFAPSSFLLADDWPQWFGPQRDGVWREKGILKKFPESGPTVRWRTPIGAGYSGPAVANGKVYITDRFLAKGARNPKSPFGRSFVKGNERVVCLDEKNGKILWKYDYDCPYRVSYAAGPRTTPVVAGGKVYTLGTMGDLYCFDANSGTKVWYRNLRKDFDAPVQTWGFSASPMVEGDALICLVGGDNVVVAFHKDTGKVLWKALSAPQVGYAPPVIREFQGKRQLIIWHPKAVAGLNPKNGELYWQQPFLRLNGDPLKAALSIPTPRKDGDRLFVTAFYDGSLMITIDKEGPTVNWRQTGRSVDPEDTKGLHSIMVTPVIKNGYIYGVCSYGELRCLNAKTGERVWSTHRATSGRSLRWANAFIVEHEDRYFLFNENGELIIADLSPKGYYEIDRAKLLAPTNTMAGPAGRRVLWSHPAFANQSIYARNDEEIVCVSLKAK